MKARPIFGLIVAAAGFAAGYLLWPAGALTRPESSMAAGEVVRVVGALLSGAVLGLGGLLQAIKAAR